MVKKFKAKESKVVAAPLFLRNISKDWSVDNMKKLDFTVMFMIYDATDVDDIVDIHKYLMKKK